MSKGKSEALKLLTDPARLLELLYSKYGDIEEDFSFLMINQFLYNKKTHYNAKFKECQYTDYVDEFLKRFYKISESRPRLPKLSNYYKNYHKFFLKPIFREYRLNSIMTKYGDNKAEVFYKNNFAHESSSKSKQRPSSSSTSSEMNIQVIDKTIFDKKTRVFIDNTQTTLTLNNDTMITQNNLNTKRENDSSFIDVIRGLLPKQNAKIKKAVKENKISLCSLSKRNLSHVVSSNKILPSPKLRNYITNFKTNIAEFTSNKPRKMSKMGSTVNTISHKKNKTYFCSSFTSIANITKNQSKKTSCSSVHSSNPLSPLTAKNTKINLIKSPKNSNVISYLNMILNLKNSKLKNCPSVLANKNSMQSQRSTSNTSGFNSESIFNSRNKKHMTSMKTFNSNKNFSKTKTTFTGSVDDKTKHHQKLSLMKNTMNYQMSRKLTSKIEEMIKQSVYNTTNLHTGNKSTKGSTLTLRNNFILKPFTHKYIKEEAKSSKIRMFSNDRKTIKK